MMNCHLCKQAAHTRTSSYLSSTTKERYHQCTNINCGHTFITMETFVRSIVTPHDVQSAPPHLKKQKQAGGC
ncbi:ogr/Delta-like zinc finger family protein [Candidatus Fukatsuia endosymbiont of Tuberolachnus salignus]|uniref:ogr/Delta-like zinc finger family protein n=1 Tax=Candidatus Fukatsuia endosymbiont of Tuberolachnus salignus TaxID=3077957 RepID=UPI00313AFA88